MLFEFVCHGTKATMDFVTPLEKSSLAVASTNTPIMAFIPFILESGQRLFHVHRSIFIN